MTPTDPPVEPVVTYHPAVPFGELPPPIGSEQESTTGFDEALAAAQAAAETPDVPLDGEA